MREKMMMSKSSVFENIYDKWNVKNDYLNILNDIYLILSNVKDLTNSQKLNYCNNQRYYIKLYLKEVLECQ